MKQSYYIGRPIMFFVVIKGQKFIRISFKSFAIINPIQNN